VFCLTASAVLAFLIVFVTRESMPAIRDVGLKALLLDDQWRPVIY